MKGINRVMMVVFLICLLAQFNDPDPVVWAVIYSVPIVGCLLWERDLLGRPMAGITALVALLFAVILFLSTSGSSPQIQALSQWSMMDAHVETLREAGGLLLISGWMAALTFSGSKRK